MSMSSTLFILLSWLECKTKETIDITNPRSVAKNKMVRSRESDSITIDRRKKKTLTLPSTDGGKKRRSAKSEFATAPKKKWDL